MCSVAPSPSSCSQIASKAQAQPTSAQLKAYTQSITQQSSRCPRRNQCSYTQCPQQHHRQQQQQQLSTTSCHPRSVSKSIYSSSSPPPSSSSASNSEPSGLYRLSRSSAAQALAHGIPLTLIAQIPAITQTTTTTTTTEPADHSNTQPGSNSSAVPATILTTIGTTVTTLSNTVSLSAPPLTITAPVSNPVSDSSSLTVESNAVVSRVATVTVTDTTSLTSIIRSAL